MSDRTRPAEVFIREVQRRVVRCWVRGLSEEAQRAVSAHDMRALAEQIGWVLTNKDMSVGPTSTPDTDFAWMVIWYTDEAGIHATTPMPRAEAEGQYEALKAGWSEVYLTRVERGLREGA